MMSPRSFLFSRQNQLHSLPQSSSSAVSPTASTPSLSSKSAPKRKDELPAKAGPTSTSDITTSAAMVASSDRGPVDARSSPIPNPPKSTMTLTRPPAPTSPVQIPMKQKSRETAHPQKHHAHHRHHGDRRHGHRPRDVHSPDAIPPSVAALLAITSIPPSKASRSLRQLSLKPAAEKRLTVESIIERSQESEKQLSLTLGKGPLDLLLSPPEELEVDDASLCDSNAGSTLSTRTVSLESMPSLGESFTTETLSWVETPFTPARRRRSGPTRRSLEPVSSPPGELEDHPLSSPLVPVDEMDFRVFESPETPDKKSTKSPFHPLKSAFKSNLTASLRALRQAARSFSTLNFPSIPPEDFLTRSILTIDPQVPFTDERRPTLEEEPTAELRRYLNPTTAARLERPSTSDVAAAPTRAYTASIQMQTYKVQRARSAPPSSGRIPYPTVGPTANAQSAQSQEKRALPLEYPAPGPRQREMRENSDFIRIAVMEMAMRKLGKLDDKRPGRARWALPPRRSSSRPYEVGADGVPARWRAVTM